MSKFRFNLRIARKLQDVHRHLTLLVEQGGVEGFFSNIENADKLRGLIEDIRDAIMDYQVHARRLSIPRTSEVCSRPRYSRISITRAVGSS